MNKNTLLMVGCMLWPSAAVQGEGRTPYAPIVKVAVLKARVDVNGEPHVRFLLTPKNPDIDIETVVITIERDGRILKSVRPVARVQTEDTPFPDAPWEILLPVSSNYLKDTELVHNQEAGSLAIGIGYNLGQDKTPEPENTDTP